MCCCWGHNNRHMCHKWHHAPEALRTSAKLHRVSDCQAAALLSVCKVTNTVGYKEHSLSQIHRSTNHISDPHENTHLEVLQYFFLFFFFLLTEYDLSSLLTRCWEINGPYLGLKMQPPTSLFLSWKEAGSTGADISAFEIHLKWCTFVILRPETSNRCDE